MVRMMLDILNKVWMHRVRSRASLALGLLAIVLVLGGCGTYGRSGGAVAGGGVSRLSDAQAGDIAIHALGLVGTPYRYGGNTPDSGFDCSGLVGYVYRHSQGYAPPRTVSQLRFWGQPVSEDGLRTGDLVLFGSAMSPSHAGIYVGGGRFVHAPSSGGTVSLDSLDSRYWSGQNPSFRRL